MKKELTKKEAEAQASDVKSKDEIKKMIIEQAHGLADGSQPSIQEIVALANQLKKMK